MEDTKQSEANPEISEGFDNLLNQAQQNLANGVQATQILPNNKSTGIQALLDKSFEYYERLPMLEIIFDKFISILLSSIRSSAQDTTTEISIMSVSSLRYQDYIKNLPLPSSLIIFKAIEWENFGLVSLDTKLIYALVNILFGGSKSSASRLFSNRPYTKIEKIIIKMFAEIIIHDLSNAFNTLVPVNFNFERIEDNPNFVNIAQPNDAIILIQLSVDIDNKMGRMQIILPYNTLNPIKDLLQQVFIGEKFDKNPEWQEYLYKEVYNIKVKLTAILKSRTFDFNELMKLELGKTIMLDHTPAQDITLSCAGIEMMSGKLGKKGKKLAINITEILNKKISSK